MLAVVDFLFKYHLLLIGLFLSLLICVELGYLRGRARRQRADEDAESGTGAIDGAVFALFGLLLAFTFSGAASRFDHRRELVVQEANAIGTAYLRVDLQPADQQPALRDLFRRYVDSRITVYGRELTLEQATAALAHSNDLQLELWRAAMASATSTNSPAVITLTSTALNDMIDITTTRLAATRMHPPLIIYLLLFVFGIATALLAGYSMGVSKRHRWLHQVLFAVLVTATMYVTVDIEFPRRGLIRVDAADRLLVELRESMR